MSDIIHLHEFRSKTAAAKPARPRCDDPVGAGLKDLARSAKQKPASARSRKEIDALWSIAEYRYDFYKQLCDLAHPARWAWERAGIEEARPFVHLADDGWYELIAKYRSARAALVRAPSPTVAALNRKKALAKHMYLCPISDEEIAKSIAADEAWHDVAAAGRRQARQNALARKAVQS